jgi:hypothetical protein
MRSKVQLIIFDLLLEAGPEVASGGKRSGLTSDCSHEDARDFIGGRHSEDYC